MTTDKEIKIGAILSYVQMGIGAIVSLSYTPIMIRILGKSEFGLYNTVASTISMISILNLGFNSSYIRFYSKYKKDNDQEGINKLNGLFLMIFSVLGIIACCCGLYLSDNLYLVFKQGLTSSEYKLGRTLMLLLTANLTVSFPMTIFTNIISSRERFIFLKSISIIKTVISPLVTIPVLLMGYGSVGIVCATVCISFFADFLYCLYCFKRLSVKFVFRHFEKGLLKDVVVFTGFLAINIIVDTINLNVDKLLLGRFKGTESVALYSVGYTLYGYYVMFSTSVSSLFIPRSHYLVNQYSGTEQRTRLTDLFIKVGRIQFLILALLASGLCFFGQPFIRFWAGVGYDESYYVALLLIIPASIALIQNIGIEIQRAEYRHKFRSVAYAIMAAINLISSYYLCQIYGVIGAAIGTAVSFIVANGIIMNIYYNRKCNIDIVLFWKKILNEAVGLIIPLIFGIILHFFVHIENVLELFACILLYTAVYCISMWNFGMNSSEKELLLKPVRRLRNHFSKQN